MTDVKSNCLWYTAILGTILMYANKTISVERLKSFTCLQNRIISITQQYFEPFDCVQMNE